MVSLKYLSRYKDLAYLFAKYGRSDVIKQMGLEIPKDEKIENDHSLDDLANDLQKLGPTYVKLGQFLSTQIDVPDEYQDVLSKLQDQAEPFPFEKVKEIIEEELKVKLNTAFLEFNPEPIGSASLSQVHIAKTHSGIIVAVKVQRPDIQQKILDDLDMLEELAEFLDNHEMFGHNFFWKTRIRSMRTALLNELDFRKEASNLKTFASNLAEFESLIVPLPIDSYTTSKVLTMEYISSKKITSIHPLVKMDIDRKKLVEDLFKAYLKQIFIDGFVHIDPHPGNLYLSDTNQIALLDLGMVEHLSEGLQEDLLTVLLAISEGKGEEVARVLVKLGHADEDFDNYLFTEEISDLVAQYRDLNWDEIPLGRLFLKISRGAGKRGLRLPQKFNTLGKMLINLDGVVRSLDASFNPNQYIQENVKYMLQYRLKNLLTQTSISNFLLQIASIFSHLPGNVNSFFDRLNRNEFRIKFQAFDEERMLVGFEKVANRVALGLVLAALIIGASLLMKVDTSFKLFGYPGLAIILFLAAVFGGILFISSIILYDHKNKHK